MIIAKDVIIPDKCPEKCCGKTEPSSMDGLCMRCPIYNCQKGLGPYGETDFCLIEPENYRYDWALEWKRWFETEMKDCPNLYF